MNLPWRVIFSKKMANVGSKGLHGCLCRPDRPDRPNTSEGQSTNVLFSRMQKFLTCCTWYIHIHIYSSLSLSKYIYIDTYIYVSNTELCRFQNPSCVLCRSHCLDLQTLKKSTLDLAMLSYLNQLFFRTQVTELIHWVTYGVMYLSSTEFWLT